MKFTDYRKRQIGDLWLNHGYNRKELGDIFQCHPNQVTVVLRENVIKGYFSEKQRQERIDKSKIEGGEMSPLKITYSPEFEQIGGFDKIRYKPLQNKRLQNYSLS